MLSGVGVGVGIGIGIGIGVGIGIGIGVGIGIGIGIGVGIGIGIGGEGSLTPLTGPRLALRHLVAVLEGVAASTAVTSGQRTGARSARLRGDTQPEVILEMVPDL